MAIIIQTESIELDKMVGDRGHYIYNGMDCCLTHEIHEVIRPQLDEKTSLVYAYERALQAPALDMMVRGMLIDHEAKLKMLDILYEQQKRFKWILDQYAFAVWGRELNPQSPAQLQTFFFKVMGLPEYIERKKGVARVSTSREALEHLAAYFYARPIIAAILALRDTNKKIATIKTGIDEDNRIRTSYSVAGTTTGRWSSSSNAFGTGSNLQNWTGWLRRIFVADPGYKLAYIDLEQAESRAVGLLAWLVTGIDNYLRACDSGDLHTFTTSLAWRDLPWTGELDKDKEIAEQKCYRDFSYRDLAKRGGHGSNYGALPPTISKHLKIPLDLAKSFQYNYFKGFPEIPQWHEHTAKILRTTGQLTTPMGRKRMFFDRLYDDSTLRAAIAYVPQSMVADILNLGMFKIWRDVRDVQLLAQIHDAVIIQYREELEDIVVPLCLDLIQTKFKFRGRDFMIPAEAQVGWNWAKEVKPAKLEEKYGTLEKAAAKGQFPNLDGLIKYKGKDTRKRQYWPNMNPNKGFDLLHRLINRQ